MSADPVKDTTARSPLAGCAILIIALLVMAFLLVFSCYALFRQYDAISKFTSETAAPVAVASVDQDELRVAALSDRLASFAKALDEADEAVLTLSPEDINRAIAAYDSFSELRETFWVTSIEDGMLHIDISFPLNGKPRLAKEGESGWITSDSRYLNGVMVARPVLLKHEVVLKIDRIEVPGKEVPIEFVEQMSPYRIAERYVTDDVLGPAMEALTRIEVLDGTVVLSKTAGEVQVDEITNETVDSATKRFLVIFGVVACAFLLFAGTIVFIGLRKSAKNSS